MSKLFISLLFFITINAQCQYDLRNPDIALSQNVNSIRLIHLESNIKSGTSVDIGDIAGTVAPLPEPLSQKYNDEINKSKAYYINEDFIKAAQVLKKAVRKEPDNPFILNEYARALYWIHGKKNESYMVYQNLIGRLDVLHNNSDTLIAIDIWFREAYWKLGVLHMDYGYWDNAFYEINRFMMSIQGENGTEIYDLALSYLTECAFELGDIELCKHFASRALFYNPNNEYVKHYLAQIEANK